MNLRILKNGRTQRGALKTLKGAMQPAELILVRLRTIRGSIKRR